MRLLASTLAALAAGPFAIWDLQTDLASVSRNAFGDVIVKKHAAVAGHGAVVRCGAWCRFGSGWLAFRTPSALTRADVTAARVRYSAHKGWTVELTLTPRGLARWQPFAARVDRDGRRRGVPDVLVLAGGGEVAATPITPDVAAVRDTVSLSGFSRASAKAFAKAAG